MFQTKVVEKTKAHILCSIIFLIMCFIRRKNNVRPQMTTRRMRFACWMPKAANTVSEHTTLIAFPPQQWFHIEPQRCVVRRFPLVLV